MTFWVYYKQCTKSDCWRHILNIYFIKLSEPVKGKNSDENTAIPECKINSIALTNVQFSSTSLHIPGPI